MNLFFHPTHRSALRGQVLLLCLLASLAALPAFAQTTWTGTSDADWNTVANWSAGVPTPTTNVTILTGTPNQPVIGAGPSAVAKSVVVNTGATLTILATGSLTINDPGAGVNALTNSGTMVNSGSVVIGSVAGGSMNYGLANGGSFTNTATGSIEINRSSDKQLWNTGSFTNLGQITIGNIIGANFGIANEGTFNHAGGNIYIVNANNSGIDNVGTITSSASMTITASTTATIGRGIYTRNTFINNAGSQLNINGGNAPGILNENRFTNTGQITLGASIRVITAIVSNGASNSSGFFNNSTCASLINIVSNGPITTSGGTFSNAGTIIENANGNSNITTNTGVVQNLNGGTFTITTNTGLLTTAALSSTWTGCTSTDWNTSDNWQNRRIPLATDDVVIPAAPANQPILGAGTTALAKSVVVQSGAVLTISSSAALAVNGTNNVPGSTAFNNFGTIHNNGQLNLGNTASTGEHGLSNSNGAIFNNNAGGTITSDRSTVAGLQNGGTFTNAGGISIGATASVGDYGLVNFATFNNAGGTITIHRSGLGGLDNRTGSFTNAGGIIIGATAAVGYYGLRNIATFNNQAVGTITLDRSTTHGLQNVAGTFTNAGGITIGAIESVGANGIQNAANFANNGCTGIIRIVSNSTIVNINPGTFTNSGTIIENATGNSNISSNSGLVQNLNGGAFNITTNTGLLTTALTTNLAIAAAPALTINTGQTATLTASGAVSYLWSTGETTAAISVSVAGPYSVTGTIGGCTSVTSVVLTVNPPVCGTLVVSPLSTTICNGTSTMFTASGGTNYLWSTGETTAAISVSVAGPYSVTATTPYCPVSETTVGLTVQPLLNVITQPAAGSSVCAGASVTAFVNVTGLPTGYQWYRNGNPIAGQTSATLSLPATAPADAGSYVVVVTGTCNSLTTSSFSLAVGTYPTPTLLTSGTLTCANLSVTLTATGGTTYTFSGPGGFTQSSSGNTASVSAPGTYTVTVANASRCSSQTTVLVNQDISLPALTLTTGGSVCQGQPISLLATAGLTNYIFSGPGTSAGSGNTRTVTGLAAGSYSFTVTANQTSNGCSGSATASATVNATPGAPTLTALSHTVTTSATPLSLLPFVQATGTLSFSATSGLLNPPNANISTLGVQNFSVTQANGSCVGPVLPFSLTVVPTTSATAGASPTVCRKSNVVLTVTATGINLSYSWLEDNGNGKLHELTGSNASTTNSLTLTNVQQSSDYYCRVTGTYGTVLVGPIKLTVNRTCTARAGSEEPAVLSVVLAPNPLENGLLRATVRGAGGQPLTVQLHDIGGYVIGQQSWEQAEVDQLIEWNVATQPAGLYLLRAVSNGQHQTVKVVKP